MDDRLRETLSAMMDDEADELSVRRLLSCEDQDSVRGQWQRWQGIHDLMHQSSSPTEGIDVSLAVRDALDGRSRPPMPAARTRLDKPKAWRWPAVATVALALLVGFGAGAGWDSGEFSSDALALGPDADAGAQADDGVQVQEIALQGLDAQQWEYMNRYLLEHAQHNSVGAGQGSVGYARLVSANGGY